MIQVNKEIANFSGTAHELTFEFVHVLLGYKNVMIKEFDFTEEQVLNLIKFCGELAFMDKSELQQYIDDLLDAKFM